jgi:hypothetical protein
MPYVDPDSRADLDPNPVCAAETPGDLNYQFTVLALDYLNTHAASYRTINDVLGALEGAKQEFYRRVAVPYEQQAIARNGDLYPDLRPRTK